MNTDRLTCPYCNASISVPPGVAAGGRLDCPRCGDSFALRPTDALTHQPQLSSELNVAVREAITSNRPPSPSLALPSRRSNGMLAALAVGVMLLMAGIGLAFMLRTQAQRRAQDTVRPARRPFKQLGVPESSNLPVVESVAPDRLEALGYLPSDVNFLVAARVPELAATSIGSQILGEPLKIGGAEHRLSDFPEWVGFSLEDIDHVVLGARIQNDLLPPFYLVIRTVHSYDAEQVRQRLKGTRVASAAKKKLFTFRPLKRDLPMHVWFADDRTVVIALLAQQLEDLAAQPVPELQQFSPELRFVLRERREPVAPMWIAGHSRDWSKTSAAKLTTKIKNEDWLKLSSLQTFGVWIIPDKSVAVKGVFACKNEAGAKGLDAYFQSLPGPEANFKSARDDVWLIVQFQTGPNFLTRLLKR
jgi:hypothetical protein